MEYPQFKNGNLTRGWYSTYCNPVDDDGRTQFDKQMKAQKEASDKELDQEMERMLDEMPLYGYNVPEFPGDETLVEAQKKRQEAVDLRKKKAATASRPISATRRSPLTASSKTSALQPKTLKQTITAAKPKAAITGAQKKPPSTLASRSNFNATHASNLSSMRHATATAASRTTIGYSKGRAASSSLRSTTKRPTAQAPADAPKTTLSGPATSSTLLLEMLTHKGAPPLYTAEEWARMNPDSGTVDEDLTPALRDLVLGEGTDEGKDGKKGEDDDDDNEVYEI